MIVAAFREPYQPGGWARQRWHTSCSCFCKRGVKALRQRGATMNAQQKAEESLERIKEIERRMEERLQQLEERRKEWERAISCPPGVDPIPRDFSAGRRYPGLG